MTTTSHPPLLKTRYHRDAYEFVFAALRHTQRKLNRLPPHQADEEEAHVSGQELLEGIRDLAVRQFGLMTRQVFAHWGITATADFGRIVFELIERGDMRKTERDQLSDFIGVYDFEEAFDRDYQIDTSSVFSG